MNKKYIVITGGPGVGKTTVLNELEKEGCRCVPEVARALIREQVKLGGDALPWKNKQHYAEMMLDRSVAQYNDVARTGADQPVFFDRSIIDTVCYTAMIGHGVMEEMHGAATRYRYHTDVFILPPWPEIYQTDRERKQTWEEVLMTDRMMREAYLQYGYRVVDVPIGAPADRAAFIMEHIAAK